MTLSPQAALRKDRANASAATFEHRHFAALAAMVARMPLLHPDRESRAVWLANELANTNPRFDRARFLKACGV